MFQKLVKIAINAKKIFSILCIGANGVNNLGTSDAYNVFKRNKVKQYTLTSQIPFFCWVNIKR